MSDADLDRLRARLSAPLPHPDPETLRAWGVEALDWLLHDSASLPGRAVGRTSTRAEAEALLRQPPPETGQPFDQVLRQFAEQVAPLVMRPNHPRFLAFIPGAPTFVSTLGDWLCAGTNFFLGVWLEAAGPTQVELVVLDWFRALLGCPPTTAGLLTGGGSEANLTALLAARERLTDGQRRDAVVYTSELRHWSVDRAAKIIGLRPHQVRRLPVGAEFGLAPATLAAAVAEDRAAGRFPWLAVANAGTTNTGAVDPLDALADVCERDQLWLHVDAAYGWAAALDAAEGRQLHGIARADSITLDPHKWFAQTFEVGCVLVRDGRRLTETFALRPDYMQDVEPAEDEVNFADRGIALSRRFRALKVWVSVKVLGLDWFRGLVRHCCELVELAEALLERAGVYEILSPRRLSIVCFRYRPDGVDEARLDALNLALLEALRLSGQAFLSSTRLHGCVALRICCVNWRTTAADIETVVTQLTVLGARLIACDNPYLSPEGAHSHSPGQRPGTAAPAPA